MRRSERIMIRRDKPTCRRLSAVAGTLFAMLVLVIALLPGKATVAYNGSVYGSFLLSAESGGYVLAAVVAFVLGVMTTLLIQKRRTIHTAETEKSERSSEHEQAINMECSAFVGTGIAAVLIHAGLCSR